MNDLLPLISRLVPSLRQWVDRMWAWDEGIGLMLVLGGLTLMFFGFSIYKVFTSLGFSLLGWWVVHSLCEEFGVFGLQAEIGSIVAGAILGVTGFVLAKTAGALLGGMIAAGLCWQIGTAIGIPGTILLVVCGIVLAGVTAVGFVRHEEVVVFACAVVGAALLVSGAASVFSASPGIGSNARQLMLRYPIVSWVAFVTPLVVGFTVQMGTLKNKGKAALQ